MPSSVNAEGCLAAVVNHAGMAVDPGGGDATGTEPHARGKLLETARQRASSRLSFLSEYNNQAVLSRHASPFLFSRQSCAFY